MTTNPASGLRIVAKLERRDRGEWGVTAVVQRARTYRRSFSGSGVGLRAARSLGRVFITEVARLEEGRAGERDPARREGTKSRS